MITAGIIAEYNPFHNGHLYHLEQTKAMCGADCIVCVMSGNFIQRGEPAIVNKWSRTEMAIKSGVDLVVELPSVYAMSSAEFFAFGAVKILDSLQCIDYLSFGSEVGSIEKLSEIADILISEPSVYKTALKQALDNGLSFPAAREAALCSCASGGSLHFDNSDNIKIIMNNSNNILGIEYLKAIKRLKSKIKPVTTERLSNTYNSEAIVGSISSATSIRKHISQLPTQENAFDNSGILKQVLPPDSVHILEREFAAGRGPVFASSFDMLILSALRRMTAEEIAALPYIAEGLENRIKSAAEASGSYEELLEAICTKRYTRTRIQRSLFSLITGLKRSEFDVFNLYGGPQYIRILGFNAKGRKLLSSLNKRSLLPVITKAADYKHSCNPLLSKMLELEASATDQYVLAYKNPSFRKSGSEFTSNIVII